MLSLCAFLLFLGCLEAEYDNYQYNQRYYDTVVEYRPVYRTVVRYYAKKRCDCCG